MRLRVRPIVSAQPLKVGGEARRDRTRAGESKAAAAADAPCIVIKQVRHLNAGEQMRAANAEPVACAGANRQARWHSVTVDRVRNLTGETVKRKIE